MNLKDTMMLAIRMSIMCTVFGFGLTATVGDLLYLVRRPGLLARSVLAVFVIMPVVAVALIRIFDLRPEVQIVLVAIAISPLPPMLPKKAAKAGVDTSYGLGLMAIFAVLSIVVVPMGLEILGRYSNRSMGIAPSAIATLVLKAAFLPLAAGIAFRAVLPGIAGKIEKPVKMIAAVLLPVAALGLLYGVLPAVWALTDARSVLSIMLFIVAGLGIGQLIGEPDPDHSVILACSAACRHPAIAFAIASTNFPYHQFAGTILLYLILSAVSAALYLKLRRRRPEDVPSEV